MYPLYKEKPREKLHDNLVSLSLRKLLCSNLETTPAKSSTLHPSLTTPHSTTLRNTSVSVFFFHKPASKGTPLPGIHDPPAKNSPTVNFTASELESTRKPPHFTLPPVPAPAPVFACSP